MGNWLTELVNTDRFKSLEKENARPAPWEGRTRARLIYGRTYNDEEPDWSFGNPPVYWEPQDDGTHTLRLHDLSSENSSSASSATGRGPSGADGEVSGATQPSQGVSGPAAPAAPSSPTTPRPGPMTESLGQSDAPATTTIISGEPEISGNGDRAAASPLANGWSLGTVVRIFWRPEAVRGQALYSNIFKEPQCRLRRVRGDSRQPHGVQRVGSAHRF